MKARKQFIFITVLFISIFSGPAIAEPCLFGDHETVQLHLWINKFRSQQGLSQLQCDGRIVDAAWEHSRQMCSDKRLHHDGFSERVNGIGIPWSWAGENAAYNWSGSGKEAVEQWMNSAPHRAIMLKAGGKYYGGGLYGCDDGKTYFTAIFIK